MRFRSRRMLADFARPGDMCKMITTTAEVFRVCIQCENRFPESCYRWRKVGTSRRSECKFCHCENERRRSRRAREKRRARQLLRACRDIGAAENVDNLQQLGRSLTRRFGGPEPLARKLGELALALPLTSPKFCDVVVAVLKIEVLAQSLVSPPEPEPPPATQAQRRALLQRELQLLLIEEPEDHAEFLRNVGWKVELPPLDDDDDDDDDGDDDD